MRAPLLLLAALLACAALAQAPPVTGQLAYLTDNTIYLKTLPNGGPKALVTTGTPGCPAFSASGIYIAYIDGPVVKVITTDGALVAAVPGYSWLWSPKHDILLIEGSGALYRLDTNPVSLTGVFNTQPDTAIGMTAFPAWRPDGQQLAFTIQDQIKTGPGQFDFVWHNSVWRVWADGTGAKRLYNAGERNPLVATWSPDGARIALWNGEIVSASLQADGLPLDVLDAATGKRTRLVDMILTETTRLSWAPDGTRLALAAGAGRNEATGKLLVIANVNGIRRTLTSDKVAVGSVAWAPNGATIAYTASPDPGPAADHAQSNDALQAARLWVIMPDGTGARQLTNDPAYRDEYPRWSKDSRTILFVRTTADKRPSLWATAPDGTGLTEIVPRLTPAQEGEDGVCAFDWHE